jgi:ribosomal protein L16/L10AE
MLIPKRVKYRKQHRGRMKGRAMRGNRIAHGDLVWLHWNHLGLPTVRLKLLVLL